MINQKSIDTVRVARRSARESFPLYNQYSFAQIPHLIRHALTGEGTNLPIDALAGLPNRYEKVILVLIDAFGWRFIEPHLEKYPFLRRFRDQGVVSMLTSQFPSTTSAHITTLGTGLTPGESGVFEWFYYEPTVDQIITPLLFALANDGPESLRKVNADPNKIYPPPLIRQQMADHNVKMFTAQPADYALSTYSRHMMADGRPIPYKWHSEGIASLTHSVLHETGKAYYFLYFDAIDSLLHYYGPGSPQVEAEIDSLLYALETHLHGALDGKAHDTLLLLTADHGQIEVAPQETIYLNQRDPSLVDLLQTTRSGQPIYFGGSARDMFFYAKPECVAEAETRLKTILGDRADVRQVADLIADGYFGTTTPSEMFMNRVSTLVILPVPGQMDWWRVDEKSEQRFLGHHGGLTPEEMEIGLLALAYP